MGRSNNRKKYIERNKKSDSQKRREGRTALIIAAVAVVLIIGSIITFFLLDNHQQATLIDLYDEKSALLRTEVLADEISGEMAEGTPERVVFISVCDGTDRAHVFTGTGKTSEEAFSNADKRTRAFVDAHQYSPVWLKADIVNQSSVMTTKELHEELSHWRNEFYRFGISFDTDFSTALLESELNGAKIIDYDADGIDLKYLINYLKKAERTPIISLPDSYIVFRCDAWFCDDDSTVYTLNNSGYEYGRRSIDTIDKEFAATLVKNASAFLIDQVRSDGSFIYGIYPRFDNEIDNYNIVRHASTLWSLVCQYRMTGNEKLKPVIDSAIDYMIDNFVIYSDDDTAYLLEQKDSEIKLGGCGIAVVALTEYMDAFGTDKYADIAVKLGNGILTMFDDEFGQFYHVYDQNFLPKEEFRTVYYDGEATFALCRLYSLTGDERWLAAAETAVNRFILEDYTQYKDHWIAYSMNEITKYVDKPEYYEFGLKNAQNNIRGIYSRDTTYHTYLELLMATFELYDRMIERGIEVDYASEFDLDFFLKTVYARADRLLDGYFFPEYAMYMENPVRILDTFMVRHDGYRVRIDDVQHSVGGYYLYYENYEKLVEYGMLECRDQ